jgi:lipopolysaccharide/colanic/teichoic acid biosynthesis glycosyltransferase
MLDEYGSEARFRICQVRPGVTGIGSVFFRDEERILSRSQLSPEVCYREVILPRKRELELWYVDKRSAALDALLLVLTAVVVVAPRTRLHERVLRGVPGAARPARAYERGPVPMRG